MSLDGYIADDAGGYDWIVPVPSPTLDTEHQLPFDDFLDQVDVVVMGRRCYEQGQHRDYVAMGKRVIIATTNPPTKAAEENGVEYVSEQLVETVGAARDSGQHCFLFGGGILVASFLAAQAVDQLTIGVVPVLLGRGRRLFPSEHPTIELRLTDYSIEAGKTRLVYQRR